MGGLSGLSALSAQPSIYGGLSPYDFDPLTGTFTPNMDKRAMAVFAAAPIVQGDWSDEAGPDRLIFPVGNQLGNLASNNVFYSNIDLNQGTIVFWFVPEWNGNDGRRHTLIDMNDQYGFRIYKHSDDRLYARVCQTQIVSVDISGWTVGARYLTVVRWDLKQTLDGTNHGCVSINNAHAYGMTAAPTVAGPPVGVSIGSDYSLNSRPGNAIIQGLHIYRRVLTDSNGYGHDVGNAIGSDELTNIYAAGAGADPTLTTGSWDVVLALPTNATAGALVTGTGEAWSHPHGSAVLETPFMEDGGYLSTFAYAIGFNGTSTRVDCGSGATLDDIPNGGEITVEAWVRCDDSNGLHVIANKGDYGSTGWILMVDSFDRLSFAVDLATTNAVAHSGSVTLDDGKWHHAVGYYNDATKAAQVAVDGRWGAANVGAGAYQADAASDLYFGQRVDSAVWYWNGVIGWPRISNNDRYTAGTDFVPPRTQPAPDGNTVEQWDFDEGTGVNAVADVTSPANDGTISNGTWLEVWDIEGTPVVPQSLEFDGAATQINCGSGATLDDLPDNAVAGKGPITAEGWFRFASHDGNASILGKGWGWAFFLEVTGDLRAIVYCATTNSTADTGGNVVVLDNRWHHVAMTYDETGDRKARIWVDGILCATGSISVGNYTSDAAANQWVGGTNAGFLWAGAASWVRISNIVRYTDDFTPNSRMNPPGVDGNTMMQLNMTDGAGTTATDSSGNANHGAITMGTGRWWNTPDMESEAPGERVFQWGYTLGADVVNEGITQIMTGLAAGQNYVMRALLSVGQDCRGYSRITIYDETNSANITTFDGPRYVGQHTGGNASATLIDAGARWPQSLIGATVYNITDGSSAVITAISGDMTTITAALAGGTDNLWDTNDWYRIFWTDAMSLHPWTEAFCFELPTIVRNGAAADCVSISVKIINLDDEGTLYVHQVELQENLLDNPSLETGAGNPWIPDGWANINLDAGDSEQELATLHSGAGSIEWNPSAADEGIRQALSVALGTYVSLGYWSCGDGSGGQGKTWVQSGFSNQAVLQYDPSVFLLRRPDTSTVWFHAQSVWRSVAANWSVYVLALEAATGDRFADDIYVFPLNDVSLTVIPASQANSQETFAGYTGLRVDGRDTLTQAIPADAIRATRGKVRFALVLRHGSVDHDEFGYLLPYVINIWGNATNFIEIYSSGGAGDIILRYNDGGGAHAGTWAAPALVAGTIYDVEIEWWPNRMILRLWQRGTAMTDRITINQIVSFVTVPTIIYAGTRQAGDRHVDAVFLAHA